MGHFDSQIASAKRAILKNGELCIWNAVQVPVADDETPWKPTPALDQTFYTNIPICFVPLDKQKEQISFMKGTEVPTGIAQAIMGAVSFVPSVNDWVIRKSGELLRVKSIDRLAPNGDTILYTIVFKE